MRSFGADAVARAVWLGAFADGPLEIMDPDRAPQAQVEAVVTRVVLACEGVARALGPPLPRPSDRIEQAPAASGAAGDE